MGGILFIPAIVVCCVVGFFVLLWTGDLQQGPAVNFSLWGGVLMALGFGLIGFLDDYIKVVKKRNLGLTEKEKLILQILVAAVYLLVGTLTGGLTTVMIVPFFGPVDFGWFFYPAAIFLIVGFVNAVNLTDGIDGLCSTATLVFAVAGMLISAFVSNLGGQILSVALAGGCMGFLVWNFHPAKVFMGDTGSLFLGGMVCAITFSMGMPIFLLLMGILYVIETGSVILQVLAVKTIKRRIFKMTPIHHSFEMSGYSEIKIVILFSLIQLAGCVVAALGYYFAM